MANFLTRTDATFIVSLTKVATFVEMPSIKAMNSGPGSLQSKLMRRICAFMVLSAAGSFSVTTTTC